MGRSPIPVGPEKRCQLNRSSRRLGTVQATIREADFTGLGRQDMGLPLRKAESMDGEVAPHNYSAFHYELDVLKLGDVGKRISGDGNDVRIIARFY